MTNSLRRQFEWDDPADADFARLMSDPQSGLEARPAYAPPPFDPDVQAPGIARNEAPDQHSYGHGTRGGAGQARQAAPPLTPPSIPGQPGYGQPGYGQPGDAQAAFSEAAYARPAHGQPAYRDTPGAFHGADYVEPQLDVSLPASGSAFGFDDVVQGELQRGGDQPVPRISIHSFCESADTAQLLQAAATDRRLAKAHSQVTFGGLAAAIEHYRSQPTPNLIVVETAQSHKELLRGLDALAALCDASTKVIVLGATNDIMLYRELMRRGVSEYLVSPLQPLQFIRTVAALYVDPEKPFVGRSIAVIGAKGGVGASTIAHNLAWCMAEHVQVNTTLVDLDLSFGTTALDFNQDSVQGVVEALASPDRVDDVVLDRLLSRVSAKLTLFTAPASLDRVFDYDLEAYEVVIERVRRGVPFVVLDLPHSWSQWVRQTLVNADDIVLVATPELAALRNTKNMIDMLRPLRRNDQVVKIVLNMVGVAKRPEIPVKEFGEALGLEPTLVLPYEPAVFGAATNNGQMISEAAGESRSAQGLEFLASVITGRQPEPKPKKSILSLPNFLKKS